MKSLEIVNKKIKTIENKGDITLWAGMGEVVISKEELGQIKQELEVLEIIKNKRVDVRELSVWIGSNLEIERALIFYNDSRSFDCRLTMEELLKLKQWLEENE